MKFVRSLYSSHRLASPSTIAFSGRAIFLPLEALEPRRRLMFYTVILDA